MLPCKCVWVLLPFWSPKQLCASHFLAARAALGWTGKLKLWIVFLLGRKQEGAADWGLGGNQSPTQREGGSWASFCQTLNYLWVPEDIPKQDTGFFHCCGIFPISPQQSTHRLMVTLCPWCHLSGVMNIPVSSWTLPDPHWPSQAPQVPQDCASMGSLPAPLHLL